MPLMKGWKTTRKAPPPPITVMTIAFFVLDWDTKTGNIHWSGVGEYLNYAFRFTAIACAVIYLAGYYLKKWTQLMRPILYVLWFGIFFALTAAALFPLGLDITGNTAGQMNDNSTHIEVLRTTTTTIASNIVVSTTEGSLNATETPEKEFTSVYSFAFVRSFVCLVLWMFHFFNYVDKFNEREEEEANERDAANRALS